MILLKIFDPDNLMSRVYYALDNIDEMSENRKKACQHYLYNNDGRASFRLVEAIEKY